MRWVSAATLRIDHRAHWVDTSAALPEPFLQPGGWVAVNGAGLKLAIRIDTHLSVARQFGYRPAYP